MNFDLSFDMSSVCVQFLDGPDLANTVRIARAGDNLSGAAQAALKQRFTQLHQVRLNIISAFTDDNVMRLACTPKALSSKLADDIKIVNEFSQYVMTHWIEDDNEVIATFAKVYKDHFILGNKIFHRMNMLNSCVAAIVMNLYH